MEDAMFKKITLILCTTFFIAAFSLPARNYDKSFFFGLGPNFNSNGAIGLAQLGLGWSLFRENNFDLQVGPLVNLGFGNAFMFDLDLFAKANHDIQISKKYKLSIYAKIPLGYSLHSVSGGGAGGIAHGINFGVIPGTAFNLSERLSFFGELGLIHRIFFVSSTTLQAATGTANFGIIFKF